MIWTHPSGKAVVRLARCEDALIQLPDASVDAVVTDPPYGIRFMGKAWDYDVPEASVWAECLRVLKPGGNLLAFSGARTYHRMACSVEDGGFDIFDMGAWLYSDKMPKGKRLAKPAMDPLVFARKPGPAHGLNVDLCRVPSESGDSRWPSNVFHDGSEGVRDVFPDAPGQRAVLSTSDTLRAGQNTYNRMRRGSNGKPPREESDPSSARFFYCARASKTERGEGNNHPTVKPAALMEYLCRLVTPPGGLILDPYLGSGTTGIGALRGGFSFYGVEQEESSFQIAVRRLAAEEALCTKQ